MTRRQVAQATLLGSGVPTRAYRRTGRPANWRTGEPADRRTGGSPVRRSGSCSPRRATPLGSSAAVTHSPPGTPEPAGRETPRSSPAAAARSPAPGDAARCGSRAG
ncbi:hypothetical protein C1J00_07980 [Streptomyces cahuitamycinicus]|uniref:Uncharacterized protein n=1 Tax=Streptomyces cahuitamycinicus TaxID=2070367 RepID=A0A2N8TUH9_9ACTN|nr:hypothetical protein C1J00_07980 [Streptomyces cahuitamycinicus]